MHSIPECLRGVFMTRHYTDSHLLYLTLPYLTLPSYFVTHCSGSSELSISVSSHLEDEDLQQLQQTMRETLARLTRFVLSLVFASCWSVFNSCLYAFWNLSLLPQSCTIFYLDTVSSIRIIFLSCSCRWAYLSEWRQVPLNGVDVLLRRYVDVSTYKKVVS